MAPLEQKALEDGDKRPIQFRFHSGTATLTIQWKEICLRFQDAKALEGVKLSWEFEANKVPCDVLTDYTIWVILGNTGGRLLCAYLEYNSSRDEIRLGRPDKEVDRIADLVEFGEDVRKDARE